MVTAAMKLKDVYWKKNNDKPRQHIKKQRHYFAYKGLYSQRYGFTSSHEQIEIWTINKAECYRIDAFKLLWCWRRLESPLNCKDIKLVSPKGKQPLMFTGRTEAEAPIL